MRSEAEDASSSRSEQPRWRYRFASFSRAHDLLHQALERDVEALSPLELAGVSRYFGFTFELGWKLLRDRLEYDGVFLPTVTPRAVVRAAHEARLIEDEDGATWMDMLGDRNKTSHMYDAGLVADVVRDIQSRYLTAFDLLRAKTREQMPS